MLTLLIRNCDNESIGYEWNSLEGFVEDMDSEKFDIPMLDDEIIEVRICTMVVENSVLQTVNDLYELLKEQLN